ncbi:hypothetical protein Bbelb_020960 [Branchiostoma belcheri]|nr:hypothetical protein Bbelb_020960 [Branchiostoma belcheri]
MSLHWDYCGARITTKTQNRPTAPCALTSRLSAPFMSALAVKHHARLHHICQRPSERRKWAYGAMYAHVPIVSALHVGISSQAPRTSTSHMSAPFGKTKAGLRRHVRSRPYR